MGGHTVALHILMVLHSVFVVLWNAVSDTLSRQLQHVACLLYSSSAVSQCLPEPSMPS